jgi:hypothetical protein
MRDVILLECVRQRLYDRFGMSVVFLDRDDDMGKMRYAVEFSSPNMVAERIATDFFEESQVPAKNTQRFIWALQAAAHEYDVCYQTYLCLDTTGHGKKGYPYDMKDCYDDRSGVKDRLLEAVDEAKAAMRLT